MLENGTTVVDKDVNTAGMCASVETVVDTQLQVNECDGSLGPFAVTRPSSLVQLTARNGCLGRQQLCLSMSCKTI